MRLRKAQKEKLLEWIASGIKTDEINSLAGEFRPPFSVTRQQVDGYRKRRDVSIKAIQEIDENNALSTGLALKENRVADLQKLAQLMKKDLFGGFLWTEETKGVGSGEAAEIIDYDVFNAAEVSAFRGVLDDIAKETGGRVQKSEIKLDDLTDEERITRIAEILDTARARADGSTSKR